MYGQNKAISIIALGRAKKVELVCGLMWLLAFFLVLPVQAQAAWVEARGKSFIINDDIETAREQALEDAVKNAVVASGVHVKHQQPLRHTLLQGDSLDITGSANVRATSILEEQRDGDMLLLKIRTHVEQKLACGIDGNDKYRKTLLVSGFSLQDKNAGMLGNIGNADRALASYLTKQLGREGNLLVYESSQYRLYDELMNAPTTETQQRTSTNVVMAAKERGVQFVVSGVIRDLSMHDPNALSSSVLGAFKRMTFLANEKRAFALEVFVHDGVSGAIVYQKNYRVDEDWDLSLNEQAPFGSSTFWETDYGQSVGRLLDDISWDLSDTLRCQPYVTRISKVNGKVVHFSSGANAGVRPGDKLSVYRTNAFYDSDLLQFMELTDVKATLEVDQVQPHFSRGRLVVDAGRLNIQEDDLLIAW